MPINSSKKAKAYNCRKTLRRMRAKRMARRHGEPATEERSVADDSVPVDCSPSITNHDYDSLGTFDTDGSKLPSHGNALQMSTQSPREFQEHGVQDLEEHFDHFASTPIAPGPSRVDALKRKLHVLTKQNEELEYTLCLTRKKAQRKINNMMSTFQTMYSGHSLASQQLLASIAASKKGQPAESELYYK